MILFLIIVLVAIGIVAGFLGADVRKWENVGGKNSELRRKAPINFLIALTFATIIVTRKLFLKTNIQTPESTWVLTIATSVSLITVVASIVYHATKKKFREKYRKRIS